MKIVTVEQMQKVEKACTSEGICSDLLMERAGLEVAKAAYSALNGVAGKYIIVLIGPGNNGGDGLVTAYHLQKWGAKVTAYLTAPRPTPDIKLAVCSNSGITICSARNDENFIALDRELGRTNLVIDAILGTGQNRVLEGTIREVLVKVSKARDLTQSLKIMSIDVPTGLDANSGALDPSSPTADYTIALSNPKIGLYQFHGATNAGQIKIVDIGVPTRLTKDIDVELLTHEWVGANLPKRPLNAHKGIFGHSLVIAGSQQYSGAADLVSQAATRVGSGLVTLACPMTIYPIVASKRTEIIYLPLPDDNEGRIHPDSANLIKSRLTPYNVLAIGCGIGQSESVGTFLDRLLLQEPRPSVPVIIDADGLTMLSAIKKWWEQFNGPVVLTPHPGEMSTLTGLSAQDIQNDRLATIKYWSSKWRQIVVLKGAYTIIAIPNGDGVVCKVSPFATPTLASGGTGDVLTGIIAGLIAQGLPADVAACCGVYIHGAAGERMHNDIGSAGTLAGDILPLVPVIMQEIKDYPGGC